MDIARKWYGVLTILSSFSMKYGTFNLYISVVITCTTNIKLLFIFCNIYTFIKQYPVFIDLVCWKKCVYLIIPILRFYNVKLIRDKFSI